MSVSLAPRRPCDALCSPLLLANFCPQTDKRDALIEQEKRYQKVWQDSNVFQSEAPSLADYPEGQLSHAELRDKHPKFFGTMAYPYMNGTLHAGHSFTVSKIEFAAGFARMQGRRVLYPQGYHCTGMPIKACADKLVREIEMFGQNFERCPEATLTNGTSERPENDPPAPSQETPREDVTKFSGKKTKAAAKTVAMKYQFQIMLAVGIPVEEIHKFADPQHWLQHFPPLCQRDLTNFGCRIDWRRSFVTTDANPYYDAFVRWQMNKLREAGKVKFGKRFTIYSAKDGQPCMDHDRSEGEGIGVQQYTALKMKVEEWADAAKSKIAGKIPEGANVYFVPATLRPETMYGQTCCFVGPKVAYGIFKATENEYLFVSERAARNMSFQGTFEKWGEFPKVADLQGSEVIGTLVDAPLSIHKKVRILPMESVKPTKGTGVVTCVPSDSPDDFATIRELAKKAEYYGIQKEWASLEIIPIIRTPAYGDLCAQFLVEKMKIQSPKDAVPLAEAKGEAYKEGYYKGTMLYGDFKGESVIDAKPKTKDQLTAMGVAFEYADPDGFVLSRSGDECVAAHLDQWYLNYGKAESGGDGEWQQTVLDHVQGELNTFSTEAKNAFEQALDWLCQWPCARQYGLGSKLPWDHNFLVESLSDSTIYMSYYTIAHLLHTDVFGKTRGAANVSAEQMTDEVWDYIFHRTNEVPTDIPKQTLAQFRREFAYWYPLDLRVSGKDLVQNHLTFCLYVHTALFPREFWPRGIRVNGHLMLNNAKMSKSSGNFLTLNDAIHKFGADATRIALADAGDGMDDANFDELVANATILRLFELRKWCEEMIKDAQLVASGEEYARVTEGKPRNLDAVQRTGAKGFWDHIFEDELNGLIQQTQENYENALYKNALKSGFYDFTNARDAYREATKAAGIGMHAELIQRYVELQALMLTPLAPHWAEYMWSDVLGKPATTQRARFPRAGPQDATLVAAREYVRSTTSNITSAEGAQQKKLAKGKTAAFDPKKDKKLTIFIAAQFPPWQDKVIELVREAFDGVTLNVKALSAKFDKSEAKKSMPFANALKKRLEAGEARERVFDRRLAFDELAVLREMVAGLRQALQKCRVVEIVRAEAAGTTGTVVGGSGGVAPGEERAELPPAAEAAMPGQPTFFFENIEA